MLFLLLLPLVAAAADTKAILVGQIYSEQFSRQTVFGELPEWLVFSNGELMGIPSHKDIGTLTLKWKSNGRSGQQIIVVSDDDTNPCGDADTTWLDVVYETDLEIIQRVRAVRAAAKKLGISVKELMFVESNFSKMYRRADDLAATEGSTDGSFMIIRPYCDGDNEAIDVATDDMDKLLDEDDDSSYVDAEYTVTITKGKVLKRISTMSTTISSRTTTSRSTRHAGDNPPVRLNSLPEFQCTRGVFCEVLVPETTFKDAEDGDTYKLDLSVKRLEGKSDWLFYKDRHLQGVPLDDGEYRFRLDAKDRRGQMATAAFSVVIKPQPKPNHKVTFELDIRSDLKKNPELLVDFVKQLALVTSSKPNAVSVRDISTRASRTIVTWSNSTLPYKTCVESAFEPMNSVMLTRRRPVMSRTFDKAMTERFNVRKVDFELEGNCLKDFADVNTTTPTVEATTADANLPMYVIIGILVCVVIAILLIVWCCAKKGKKEKKTSEYTGKGHPVVFPEEIADEHELAHAATPMLTKEERPPLKVSQHENPLYKPPPPLAVSSPRVGTATTLPTQKMPPPYVPP